MCGRGHQQTAPLGFAAFDMTRLFGSTGPSARPTDASPSASRSSPRTGSGGSTRIGDDDRRATDAVLSQAMSLGYLNLEEWDARSARVLAATTAGDLAAVTADLPVTELRHSNPVRRRAGAATARGEARAQVTGWLGLVVLMIVIWLAVAVPTGAWYPWPIWPILGTGIGLVSHLAPSRAALRRS